MNFINKFFGKKDVTDSLAQTISNVNPLDSLNREEKKEISDNLAKIAKVLLVICLFFLPLLFVPVLADGLDFPKYLLIFFTGVLSLFLLTLKSVLSPKTPLTLSPLHLPLILVAVFSLISIFIADNKIMAAVSDPLLLIGGVAFFISFTSLVKNDSEWQNMITAALAPIVLLAVLMAVQILYFALAPSLKLNLNSPFLGVTFSPAGSPLSVALLSACLLPLSLGLTLKIKSIKNYLLTGAVILCLLLSGVVLFQNRPLLLSIDSGWKIATGTLGQSFQNALFGVGPSHFIDSFTSYKTSSFNSLPFWNLRFTTSSNFYFYLLTTFGIANLAAFLFIAYRVALIAKSRLAGSVTTVEKGLLGSLILSFIALAVFPGPTVVIFNLFFLLSLLVSYYRLKDVNLFAREIQLENQAPVKTLAALALLVAVVFSAYHLGTFVLADYYFNSSLLSAAANRGAETYNLQIKALQLNPYNSNYRVSYSQTNLALANSLAGNTNLSDQDRQTIITLVQQALREGRLAVATQPRRSANWENLALIYRNLINFAQGADQWAVASENQAIQFDPTNPRLRLDQGGTFFALKDYSSAVQLFNLAATLKPDYANAYYNLAQALIPLNQKTQAVQALQTTSTLICTATPSADCQKVKDQINSLSAEAAKETSPAPAVTPAPTQAPLATPGGQKSNLPKASITPPPKVSTESGEITR